MLLAAKLVTEKARLVESDWRLAKQVLTQILADSPQVAEETGREASLVQLEDEPAKCGKKENEAKDADARESVRAAMKNLRH